MEHRNYIRLAAISVVLAAVTIMAFILAPAGASAGEEGSTTYEVKASNAALNREITGPVTDQVDGVAAAPVDSFTWDGIGRTAVEDASVEVEIDPESNTGFIKAEWTDDNGQWTFEQTAFAPPVHPSGLEVTSALTTRLIEADPVTTNVYLHGDTMAGGPVLPTIFNYLATWGPAQVTLNGEPFENPYDGPVPNWAAHTMTTAGVRNPDGTVRISNGELYDFSKKAEPGAIDPDDLEFHLVFHDAPGPTMTDNLPPPLSFFYHLTFEDVKLEVKHSE